MKKFLSSGNWKHSTFKAYLDSKGNYKQFFPNITAAVCICFNSKGDIFLTKHKDGGYDLLGGKIEAEESVEDTLKREALEEAG